MASQLSLLRPHFIMGNLSCPPLRTHLRLCLHWLVVLSGRRRSAEHNSWHWEPHFQGVLVQPCVGMVPWAGCHSQWESTSCSPGAWFHLEKAQFLRFRPNPHPAKAWQAERLGSQAGSWAAQATHRNLPYLNHSTIAASAKPELGFTGQTVPWPTYILLRDNERTF